MSYDENNSGSIVMKYASAYYRSCNGAGLKLYDKTTKPRADTFREENVWILTLHFFSSWNGLI